MSNYDGKNEISVGAVIVSVLIPIVGYVLYFVKKDEQQNAEKNYLLPAIVGSIVGALLFL